VNRRLAYDSLKRGSIAGVMAIAGGFAWQWLSGSSGAPILPVVVGIAVGFAATAMLYLQGRTG
jgi:hypothetical protein